MVVCSPPSGARPFDPVRRRVAAHAPARKVLQCSGALELAEAAGPSDALSPLLVSLHLGEVGRTHLLGRVLQRVPAVGHRKLYDFGVALKRFARVL